MSLLLRRSAAVLLGVAALGLATPARAAAPAGTVTFLAGDATRSGGGRVEPLATGGAVHEGDTVETRRRSRLELTLADGSVVRLGPASRLVLQAAVFGKSAEERRVSARLGVGRVWANVAKAVGGEARFEVETDNAVAGVRGTTFRVDAARDRSVVVRVYSGAVAVAGGAIPRRAHDASGAPAGRREVAGPQEVTREQWEKLVTSMMEVRVSAAGVPGALAEFALARAGKDDWEAWNRRRDAGR